jgi:hypothetical protein
VLIVNLLLVDSLHDSSVGSCSSLLSFKTSALMAFEEIRC